MKYDKLFLAGAIVLFLSGVGYYILQAGSSKEAVGTSFSASTIQSYEPLVVLEEDSSEVKWTVPKSQSSGWIYEVFSPPKIYINPETGEFSASGYQPSEPQLPFEIILEEIKRIPYRLQLEGFIEEDRNLHFNATW